MDGITHQAHMKSLTLKSIVVTAVFAATGAFGAETGLPFEQTQFDRAPSNVPHRCRAGAIASASNTLAYSASRWKSAPQGRGCGRTTRLPLTQINLTL
ncbi:MAG: hypothetical protein EPO20_17935 [Betaproteobacteria bacterium]|nr:MAG: hypothetical protein EPO20_17935 [Betaproteobacteria bacterium]